MAIKQKRYKIKLSSGRILGPLDLARVDKLAKKKKLQGDEQARVHPDGDWVNISEIPELAEILLSRLEGGTYAQEHRPADTKVFSASVDLGGTTKKLPTSSKPLPGMTSAQPAGESLKPVDTKVEAPPKKQKTKTEKKPPENIHPAPPEEEEEEKTMVADPEALEEAAASDFEEEEATVMAPADEFEESQPDDGPSLIREKDVSQEKTIVFQRKGKSGPATTQRLRDMNPRQLVRLGLIGVLFLFLVSELFTSEEKTQKFQTANVRPQLPRFSRAQANPEESQKLYAQAMKFYVIDNVKGYRDAAKRLLLAATYDISNVKALAMLASTYIALIDSSNKDADYFNTISRLIEMSRAKKVDLPETVIADVEYYVTVNLLDAAKKRLIDYTNTHRYGPEMFFYLAYLFYHRGDYTAAARYVSQIPPKAVFTPRIYYLRAQIALAVGNQAEALNEYKKAIQKRPDHARSRLGMARVMDKLGNLKDAAKHLVFLEENPALLAPMDRAEAFYLNGRLNSLYKKWDHALSNLEKAVALNPENSLYVLDYFTLKAKAGAEVDKMREQARMFYFLGEGEKKLKKGDFEGAVNEFLRARKHNEKSVLPVVKIGDAFVMQNNYRNAKINYQKATEMAPKSVRVWAKYVRVLIESFEWDETKAAIAKLRSIPGAQSYVDKLAGDMYAKQKRYGEAASYYRRAMARDNIDSNVYVAYANSLVALEKYKDAPLFFALARRFDPFNVDAIVGNARVIAEQNSLSRAIGFLEEELKKTEGLKSELLTAIAELQFQKGEWSEATGTLQRAIAADRMNPEPHKILGKIYLSRQSEDKRAIDKAKRAFDAYLSRNPSDPYGYLERYRIYIKKTKFDLAAEELDRIFRLYPKYPGLHFYKGHLYSVMGNTEIAVKEFQIELRNHPGNVNAMVALGKVLLEAKKAADALKLFSRAMQLAPSSAEPKHQAGYANFLLKNYAGAVALFRSAANIDKGNPVLFKRMGMAYMALGKTTEGKAAFQKYLELAPDAPDRAQFQQFQ